MTFLELRAAIVATINKAKNLTPEEVYGVIASIETEVRYGLITMMQDKYKEIEK